MRLRLSPWARRAIPGPERAMLRAILPDDYELHVGLSLHETGWRGRLRRLNDEGHMVQIADREYMPSASDAAWAVVNTQRAAIQRQA